MSDELKTQGTKLYFMDQSGELMQLNCPTGLTGLGGARGQIPSTCLDVTDDETFVPALGVPGQVTVPFNFKPNKLSQRELFSMKQNAYTTNWLVAFTDGTGVPEVTSNGDFTPPTDRTSAEFTAFVADVNIDVATNEIVRGTLVLQRSGAVTWNWNGPTGS